MIHGVSSCAHYIALKSPLRLFQCGIMKKNVICLFSQLAHLLGLVVLTLGTISPSTSKIGFRGCHSYHKLIFHKRFMCSAAYVRSVISRRVMYALVCISKTEIKRVHSGVCKINCDGPFLSFCTLFFCAVCFSGDGNGQIVAFNRLIWVTMSIV